MRAALKNAGISGRRSEMRTVEGAHQRTDSETNLQATGQSGRENLQTNPVVTVVRLLKEIRIAELK